MLHMKVSYVFHLLSFLYVDPFGVIHVVLQMDTLSS
jgi:hypothetical protein